MFDIKEAMKQAATRDFVSEGGCSHCESVNVVCTNRAFIGGSMFEDYKCNDCGEMTFHEIENY